MREVERQRNREREGRNRREGRRERREAEYQMRCVVHRCCCNTILHSIPSDGEPAWPGGGGETDGVEGLEDGWQLVGQQLHRNTQNSKASIINQCRNASI